MFRYRCFINSILEGNLEPIEITGSSFTDLNWARTAPFKCRWMKGRGFAFYSYVCYLAQLFFILTVTSKKDWNTSNNNRKVRIIRDISHSISFYICNALHCTCKCRVYGSISYILLSLTVTPGDDFWNYKALEMLYNLRGMFHWEYLVLSVLSTQSSSVSEKTWLNSFKLHELLEE